MNITVEDVYGKLVYLKLDKYVLLKRLTDLREDELNEVYNWLESMPAIVDKLYESEIK